MIVLSGGDVVCPDRILTSASVLMQDNRIVAIAPHPRAAPAGTIVVDVSGCYVLPGFIDVHVHGIEGIDTLDEGRSIEAIAGRLPRYGVTAFCPTTVACPPDDLRRVLRQVARARIARPTHGARVLAAHLESNFVNPDYAGAQPAACLRLPPSADDRERSTGRQERAVGGEAHPGFSGADILDVIDASRSDVGIVTLAPELKGGVDLVAALVAAGHRVSLGHTGATFEEASAAIDAGARHATHLFNRMTPMTHRMPGVAGAVLAREEVAAELICDGHHVHPSMCRIAIAAKGPANVLAITDGTAGSGLPVGARARLGGRPIRVGETALLDDGTLAGSVQTMDGAFRTIVTRFGLSIADAATMCSTSPARHLGLSGFGVVAEGAIADLVVFDRMLRLVRTFVDGEEVYARA